MAKFNSLDSPAIKFITTSLYKKHTHNKFSMFEDSSNEPNNQPNKEKSTLNKNPRQARTSESLDWQVTNNVNDRCHELMNNSFVNLNPKKSTIAIKGPSGSIRGHKNCVKKNIDSILTTIVKKNNRNTSIDDLSDDDCDICIAYVTSLGVIRKTYEDCRLLKSILFQNFIYYEERDIYLNYEYRLELKKRCGDNFIIPAVFLNGQYIGGVDIIGQLNETGEIGKLLANSKMDSAQTDTCGCCGNARFIPCVRCHGSTKSKVQHYLNDSVVLKCSRCINGLVQCPLCLENMRRIRHDRNVSCH